MRALSDHHQQCSADGPTNISRLPRFSSNIHEITEITFSKHNYQNKIVQIGDTEVNCCFQEMVVRQFYSGALLSKTD